MSALILNQLICRVCDTYTTLEEKSGGDTVRLCHNKPDSTAGIPMRLFQHQRRTTRCAGT